MKRAKKNAARCGARQEVDMRKLSWLIMTAAILLTGSYFVQAEDQTPGEGSLQAVTKEGKALGEFPLKHTEVNAKVSGYIARVEVKQQFVNPYKENIEAVYVFPLPNDAAVDDMTIKVGERTIKGLIKKREEARKIYDEAKQQGHIAALLEQERANIFTQSVANIVPGDSIDVTIQYVQVLKYDQGQFEYNFPMVVGPRYIPGQPDNTPSAGGWAPNTNQVPDASRITPPVLKPGERSGHDINVTVQISAGMEIYDVTSVSHKIDVSRQDNSNLIVKLHPQDTVPNKDLIIRYKVAGDAQQYAVLTHNPGNDGSFLMMIQPKASYQKSELTPKEIIFVIDTSGSQMGAPVEKEKEVVLRFLKGLNPGDSFQILNFSNSVSGCFTAPSPNTSENIAKAENYIKNLSGEGGTEMLEAIKACLDYPADPNRMRIVAFLTDGFIGNDDQILAAIQQKLGGARLFSFGVSSSPNRYLLDNMAKAGRGGVQYVRPDEDNYAVVEKFYKRINNPCMVDVALDIKGVTAQEIYPQTIPDLFDSQPLFIYGKYQGSGKVTVTLKGKMANKPVKTVINADFPAKQEDNDVIATIWARQKIEDLMSKQYSGEKPEIRDQVTEIALKYRLMSQYTSFVAVEETFVVEGGQPKTVQVPVEMPEYVSYEGVFGNERDGMLCAKSAWYAAPAAMKMSNSFVGAGSGYRAEAAYEMSMSDGFEGSGFGKTFVGAEWESAPTSNEVVPQTPIAAVAAAEYSGSFNLVLKKSQENVTYEIQTNGYLFKTAADNQKKLVRKLSAEELSRLRQLLAALNIAGLTGQTYQGPDSQLTITLDSGSAQVVYNPAASSVEPVELVALTAYLAQLL